MTTGRQDGDDGTPDAMEANCLASRIKRLTTTLMGTDRPHDTATLHSVRKLLFIVRDLERIVADNLSAPVPPADGTLGRAWEALARLRAMTPVEFKAYHSCIDLFATALRGISSGTGAAEPFGWLAADGKFSLPAEMTREQFLSLFPKPLIGTPVIALYTAPPVKGDREAIARIICCRDGCTCESVGESCIAIDEALGYFKTADAILSLPVQPSAAPNRESLAQAYALNRWKEKLENLPDEMKDDCYNFAGAFAGVQSDAGEREAFNRNDVVRLVLAARAVAFGDDHGGEAGMRELDSASEQFAASIPWASIPWDDQPEEQQ